MARNIQAGFAGSSSSRVITQIRSDSRAVRSRAGTDQYLPTLRVEITRRAELPG